MLAAMFWVAAGVSVWMLDLHVSDVTRRSLPGEVFFIAMLYLRAFSPFAAAITLFGLKWGLRVGASVLAALLLKHWIVLFLRS